MSKKITKSYMISVFGKGMPTKVHFSLTDAEKEAKRLAAKEMPSVVTVLEIIRQYQGQVDVKDHPLPTPIDTIK